MDKNVQLQGGVTMKTKKICETAIIAAIYVVLTMINPISWGVMQFRVSNVMCALPFRDKKYAAGVLLGIGIANAFSPLGMIDVAFGVAAEALCYLLFVWGPLKNTNIATKLISLSIFVSLIIGAELNIVYSAPYFITVFGLFISTIVIVTIGDFAVARPITRVLERM